MAFTTVLLDGGLDLQSSPISVTPGRLTACDNFEIAQNQGCRRVDGFERFDGGPSPSTSDCIAFLVAGSITSPIVGRYGFIDDVLDAAIVVGTVSRGKQTLVVMRANAPVVVSWLPVGSLPTLNIYVNPDKTGTLLTSKVASGPHYPLTDGALTAIDWQTMVDGAYMAIRANVQPVPGVGSVAGLFWMKDGLYAARDYMAVTATGIADDLLGEDAVTATGFSAIVHSVRREPDGSGVIVFRSPVGSVTSGTLLRGVSTVATITGATDSPGAGLYKAVGTRGSTPTTGSWEHQDIGYSLRFKDGNTAFAPMNRLTGGQPDAAVVQNTEWFVADTGITATMSANPGITLQDKVDNIKTDDGDSSYVFAVSTVQYGSGHAEIAVRNFGITDDHLPDGSIISGLEVEVKRRSRVVGTDGPTVLAKDWLIRLESGATLYPSFADTVTAWPKSATDVDNANYATATYGGATDLLGCSGITASDVKSENFALRLQVQTSPEYPTATPSINARVTLVRIRVHFIPPQPSYYIWDGSTAQVVNVVRAFPDSGSVDTNDQAGTLFVMIAGVPRAVNAGEEIRSMPQPGTAPDGGAADGSEQIATVAGSMTRNMLDGTAKLVAAGSKYRHVTANFYASADFEAMHGVSGAGPAFLYDGYAFARILTGTPIEKDTPRHVTVHQSRLFLGYDSGSVQSSAPGDPLDFSALNGASEAGVASPVHGMYPLNGQTLAIFTRDNVQMMQGDVAAPTMGFVTPNTGCIEFTATSSGTYLYTSNRGVETMAQTPSYGDFANQSLSHAVAPWLSPRVQRSVAFEGLDRSVSDALVVRNKQQYRLFFKDKRILTATFLRPNELPQFTLQTHPVLWTVLMSATESTGRDRLFGATDDGYVYELDRGNRFDDAVITFSATLAVDDQKLAFLNKTFTDGQIHGVGTDYGTFTMSRSVNYDAPDPAITYDQRFGEPANLATGQPTNFMSATEIAQFGRSITFRFDGSTGTQPPITLQAISYNAVENGEKRT